jgi:hypothetical protein
LRRLIGISVTNPLNNLSVHTTDAELITASRQMFVLLMFQYAGYVLLIFPINWWYRRRGPASYGLTRAGCSWMALILAGLGTVALSAWPVESIELINVIRPLGETAPWRQALFDMSWRRWEFWLGCPNQLDCARRPSFARPEDLRPDHCPWEALECESHGR